MERAPPGSHVASKAPSRSCSCRNEPAMHEGQHAMTATTTTTVHPDPAIAAAPDVEGEPTRRTAGRGRWALAGAAGAIAAFASIGVSMPTLTEEQASQGVDVIDELDRSGYHLGFVLGLVGIACLLVAAQGWRRWAEERAPDSTAARLVGQGLATTATVNIAFVCLMGSMALYLPGGPDEGWLSREAIFTNFTLLDFGALLGWWGAALSAGSVAVLAFGRRKVLPRWMGVVSVVLLVPPLAMAAAMGLPGFVGFAMPIWLVAISLGMAFGTAGRAAA